MKFMLFVIDREQKIVFKVTSFAREYIKCILKELLTGAAKL